MMKKTIFFDLDGTLWSSDAKRFPCMKPAWDRLPKAVERFDLQLPEGFDWTKLEGSTDAGVVFHLLAQIMPGSFSLAENKRKIIDLMDEYFLENVEDISEAVFPGTEKALQNFIDAGFEIGVITGNSGKVTKAKLEASGLSRFFKDESLWFCGDVSLYRWDLLDMAHDKNKEMQNKLLIYCADTMRDVDELIHSHYIGITDKRMKLLIRDPNGELRRKFNRILPQDYSCFPHFSAPEKHRKLV